MEDDWVRYEDGRLMPRFSHTKERFGNTRIVVEVSEVEVEHYNYHKWTHMEIIREECEAFVNDPTRLFRDGDAFPQLSRMGDHD